MTGLDFKSCQVFVRFAVSILSMVRQPFVSIEICLPALRFPNFHFSKEFSIRRLILRKTLQLTIRHIWFWQ